MAVACRHFPANIANKKQLWTFSRPFFLVFLPKSWILRSNVLNPWLKVRSLLAVVTKVPYLCSATPYSFFFVEVVVGICWFYEENLSFDAAGLRLLGAVLVRSLGRWPFRGRACWEAGLVRARIHAALRHAAFYVLGLPYGRHSAEPRQCPGRRPGRGLPMVRRRRRGGPPRALGAVLPSLFPVGCQAPPLRLWRHPAGRLLRLRGILCRVRGGRG